MTISPSGKTPTPNSQPPTPGLAWLEFAPVHPRQLQGFRMTITEEVCLNVVFCDGYWFYSLNVKGVAIGPVESALKLEHAQKRAWDLFVAFADELYSKALHAQLEEVGA